MYSLQGVGLMKIARKLGITYNWLAWVPFGNIYLLGEVGVNDIFGIVLTLGQLVYSFNLGFQILPFWFTLILGFTLFVLWSVALHGVYKRFSREPVALSVATVLTGGFLGTIFLFLLRNNEIIDEDALPERDEETSVEAVEAIEQN
jgi:hypothetical protein